MGWSASCSSPGSLFIIVTYRDDDVPLLVARIDIAVRLDDLLERIAASDDRFDLARLDQLFDKHQIFHAFLRVQPGNRYVGSIWCKRFRGDGFRELPNRIEDDVKALFSR